MTRAANLSPLMVPQNLTMRYGFDRPQGRFAKLESLLLISLRQGG
jgi:hypothetical protein